MRTRGPYFVLNTVSSLFLVHCTLYAMMFLHSTCMYVFKTIRTCGFWKAHNTLFNSKRLANEPRQLLTIIDNFDMVLYMYVAVLLVFDRISYRPGKGRMQPNVVSTKLNSTKRRPLDVIENSLMLLAVPLPHAIKCLKKKPIASSC